MVISSTLFVDVAISKVVKKSEKQEASSDSLIKQSSKSFSSNASSLKEILENSKDVKDPKELQSRKNDVKVALDSMLDNNKKLQDSVKAQISQEKDPAKKKALMRDILPNLQNINRQLERIKLGNNSASPNFKNIYMQADRVKESIDQVIDRIDSNGF